MGNVSSNFLWHCLLVPNLFFLPEMFKEVRNFVGCTCILPFSSLFLGFWLSGLNHGSNNWQSALSQIIICPFTSLHSIWSSRTIVEAPRYLPGHDLYHHPSHSCSPQYILTLLHECTHWDFSLSVAPIRGLSYRPISFLEKLTRAVLTFVDIFIKFLNRFLFLICLVIV